MLSAPYACRSLTTNLLTPERTRRLEAHLHFKPREKSWSSSCPPRLSSYVCLFVCMHVCMYEDPSDSQSRSVGRSVDRENSADRLD